MLSKNSKHAPFLRKCLCSLPSLMTFSDGWSHSPWAQKVKKTKRWVGPIPCSCTFECFDFHLGSHWENLILALETVLMVNLEEENIQTEVKVSKILAVSFFSFWRGALGKGFVRMSFIMSDGDSICPVSDFHAFLKRLNQKNQPKWPLKQWESRRPLHFAFGKQLKCKKWN